MPLTKAFRETVYERAQRDARFHKALLTEAINAYLRGDEPTGKAVLRDVINATIDFEQLAAELQKPSKSLHRMLGPNGNPSTANFFAILQVLQKHVGVKLTVKAAKPEQSTPTVPETPVTGLPTSTSSPPSREGSNECIAQASRSRLPRKPAAKRRNNLAQGAAQRNPG